MKYAKDEFRELCEKIAQAAHDAEAAASRGDWHKAAAEMDSARYLAQDAKHAALALVGLPPGYTVRCSWISPMEGYEFRVSLMGRDEVLAYRKSERAAVNFANRHASQAKRGKHANRIQSKG